MQKQLERIAILILSIAVGVLIALQLKSVTNASRRVSTEGLALQEVREQLNEMVDRNQDLSNRNRELDSIIQEIMNESSESNTQIQFYLDEIRRLMTFAGLNDVQGPGGVIQISVTEEAYVSAAELLVILNELKASGVEALSVNGQRVVAMTEIRSLGAGGAEIQMNGERITGEEGFTIHVIGDPAKIRGAMDFLTETIARMRIDGKNVTVTYPETVQVTALSEASPAYRNTLMEVLDQLD